MPNNDKAIPTRPLIPGATVIRDRDGADVTLIDNTIKLNTLGNNSSILVEGQKQITYPSNNFTTLTQPTQNNFIIPTTFTPSDRAIYRDELPDQENLNTVFTGNVFVEGETIEEIIPDEEWVVTFADNIKGVEPDTDYIGLEINGLTVIDAVTNSDGTVTVATTKGIGGVKDDNLLDFKKFVNPVTGTVGSKIGLRGVIKGIAGTANHKGIDISAPQGTPVYSSTAGKVVVVGASGYGENAVYIQIDPSFYKNPSDAASNPRYIVYGHMDTNTVKVGQTVTAGQQIGTVGNKGISTGPHLHYQIQSGTSAAATASNINKYFPNGNSQITANTPFVNA